VLKLSYVKVIKVYNNGIKTKGDKMNLFKEAREKILHDICSKMCYYHKINKSEIDYALNMTDEVVIYSYKDIKDVKISLK